MGEQSNEKERKAENKREKEGIEKNKRNGKIEASERRHAHEEDTYAFEGEGKHTRD